MGLDVRITGGTGNNFEAKVTKRRELVVAALEKNQTTKYDLTAATPQTFYPPVSGHQFLITGIIATRTKGGGSTGAQIEIYESTVEGGTSSKDLLSVVVAVDVSLPISAVNILVSRGVWLVASSDISNAALTILGYYIEED